MKTESTAAAMFVAALGPVPMTPWLVQALRAFGLDITCFDATHARAALRMQLNKTDQNDAEGLAQILCVRWHQSVQVKSTAVRTQHEVQPTAPDLHPVYRPLSGSTGQGQQRSNVLDPLPIPDPGGFGGFGGSLPATSH